MNFAVFAGRGRPGGPEGQHREAHIWKIPYVSLRGGEGVSVPILSPSDSLFPFQVEDALIQTPVCMVRKDRE